MGERPPSPRPLTSWKGHRADDERRAEVAANLAADREWRALSTMREREARKAPYSMIPKSLRPPTARQLAIAEVVQAEGGNKSAAARRLKVSRAAVTLSMAKLRERQSP